MKRKRKTGDANSIYEPRRSVGRHQPKMSESPTIYVHITVVSVCWVFGRERGDGHKYKAPTELGASIGITSAWKDGTQGQYLAVAYDANAQLFLLENFFK